MRRGGEGESASLNSFHQGFMDGHLGNTTTLLVTVAVSVMVTVAVSGVVVVVMIVV